MSYYERPVNSRAVQKLRMTASAWQRLQPVTCTQLGMASEQNVSVQIALDMYSSRSRMVATRTLRISGKCCRTMGIWPRTEPLLHGGLSGSPNRSGLFNMLIYNERIITFPQVYRRMQCQRQKIHCEMAGHAVDTTHVGVLACIDWEESWFCIAQLMRFQASVKRWLVQQTQQVSVLPCTNACLHQ